MLAARKRLKIHIVARSQITMTLQATTSASVYLGMAVTYCYTVETMKYNSVLVLCNDT